MTCATLSLDAAAATTWDAIVVGAGPAGSIAARQLAREGARVLLLDKKNFPRRKVCGACLNGRALGVLHSVGLAPLVANLGGIPLDGFELRLRGRAARLALPAGAALARTTFDDALAAEAIASGAAFLPRTQAAVEPVRGDVRGVRLWEDGRSADAAARVVLLAAGLGHGCLEGEPSIRTAAAARSRVGAGCTVADAPASYRKGTIHMAVSRAGYVGLVRVEDDALNVAAALDPAFMKPRGAAASAAAILAEAGFAEVPALARADWRGTATLTRRTRPLAAARLFLIGDAAGYVEPFTGEGMAWALASATAVTPLALRAVERWTPELPRVWAHEYRQLIGRRQALCEGLALVLRHPRLAGAVFALIDRVPGLARPFLRALNTPPLTFEASGL